MAVCHVPNGHRRLKASFPGRAALPSSTRTVVAGRASEHAAERMPFEQVAELEVFAEHIKTLVTAKPLQLGRMDAALHAGGQGAALEAMAAEFASHETRRDGAGVVLPLPFQLGRLALR